MTFKAPAENKKHTARMAAWRKQVYSDSRLRRQNLAKNVATALTEYVNSRKGTAWPSHDTLCKALGGPSRYGLQKAIDVLASHGHVEKIERFDEHGGQSSNLYRPLLWSEGGANTVGTPRANRSEHPGAIPSGQGVPTPVGTNLLEQPLKSEPLTAAGGGRCGADAALQIQANSIAHEIVRMAGLPVRGNLPPHWQRSSEQVVVWLKKGYPPGVILLGTQIALARRKLRGELDPPASIRYFEKPIEQAWADRNRPLPAIPKKYGVA